MSDYRECTLADGTTVRVMNNNILVERLPLSKMTASGLYLPNPESEDATAIGVVLAVGQLQPKDGDPPVPITGIEPGMRCAFPWFYAVQHTNRRVQQCLGDNYIFLKWDDILLVWPADEEHTISNIKGGNT